MNILLQFHNLFVTLLQLVYDSIGVHNLGIAVVEIAVLSKIVLYPFLKQQGHYQKKMGELQPHLNALKEKHKGDKQAFAAAQMDLYKQHGVNPAAGCLPSIVQIAVLLGLYSAIGTFTTKHGINTVFLGVDMAKPNIFHIGGFPYPLPGLIVIAAALTQFIQTKLMMPMMASPQTAKPAELGKDKPGEKKEEDFMTEFAQAQSSMIWLFPLLFLFWGTQKNFPAALALYWSVGSVIAIWQQYRISGLGGLESYVVKSKALLKQFGM